MRASVSNETKLIFKTTVIIDAAKNWFFIQDFVWVSMYCIWTKFCGIFWSIKFTEIKCFQKQPCADILKNRCSLKFGKLHRKTTVPESLFRWNSRNIFFCITPSDYCFCKSLKSFHFYKFYWPENFRNFHCPVLHRQVNCIYSQYCNTTICSRAFYYSEFISMENVSEKKDRRDRRQSRRLKN